MDTSFPQVYLKLEFHSISVCDDSTSLEMYTVHSDNSELCSKSCDIASFRVQKCWQLSAACIVPLNLILCDFWMLCCKKKGKNFTDAVLLQVCLGLLVVTTLDNDGTSRFQILDNQLGLALAPVCVQEGAFDYLFYWPLFKWYSLLCAVCLPELGWIFLYYSDHCATYLFQFIDLVPFSKYNNCVYSRHKNWI